jgi:hypothetical protein
MTPLLFVDYTFTLLYDGSIKMDAELTPQQMQICNGDMFIAYTNSGSIFFRKYVPSNRCQNTLSSSSNSDTVS